MRDIGTLGGRDSRANAINNAGDVVGISTIVDVGMHAFLYRGGAMRDLGTLGGSTSEAHGLNDGGEVVGEARTALGETHAFLYSGGAMYDLNLLIAADSGWVLITACTINDAGQIAGSGLFRGRRRAFLWTPLAAR
jgi:probable HAF family extracellular repeat protein